MEVQAVKTPSSGRAYQCFPGFANFHGDFITGFSCVAALLNARHSKTEVYSVLQQQRPNPSLGWMPRSLRGRRRRRGEDAAMIQQVNTKLSGERVFVSVAPELRS